MKKYGPQIEELQKDHQWLFMQILPALTLSYKIRYLERGRGAQIMLAEHFVH